MTVEPPAGRGLTRGASLAIACAIFVFIVVYAAGNFCVDVLLQGSIDAAVVAVWLFAAFGYGRLLLRKSHDNTPPGLRCVTAVALGLGALGMIELGLGLTGVLTNVTAWAALAVGVVVALAILRDRSPFEVGGWLAGQSASANVDWLWAVPVAIGFVAASMAPGFLWKPLDPHPYDVLSYHLQIPREWYDAGRIIPLRHNSFSFFPMGMETHFLTAMHLRGGPWAAMYLCQFVSLAHGVLAAAGVTTVCRSLRVRPVPSSLAGVMTLAVPWTLMLSSVCYVESGVMLYTLLAAAWAVRAMADDASQSARAQSPVRAMTLAGVFAGLACGMKYTAVAMTAVPLLVLWPVVARRGSGLRRIARPWLAGVVACGVVFAPWLVRNAVLTGNPVFPLAADVFGPGHFTPDQVDRYQQAHSPPPAERPLAARLRAAWQGVIGDPQSGYLLTPLTLAAAAVAWRSRSARFVALLLAAAVGVWLFATHLLPRFLSPAVPPAVVLIALAIDRLPNTLAVGGRWVMGVQIGVGLAWTWVTLSAALPLGRQGLFRLSDMTILGPPETQAARTSGAKIALIGDAQAFLYVVPSERLLYRGVFDIIVPPGATLADAWLGRGVDELRRAGFWVVISTSEMERLSRTYAHLPKPAAPFDVVTPTPVVLPPLP